MAIQPISNSPSFQQSPQLENPPLQKEPSLGQIEEIVIQSAEELPVAPSSKKEVKKQSSLDIVLAILKKAGMSSLTNKDVKKNVEFPISILELAKLIQNFGEKRETNKNDTQRDFYIQAGNKFEKLITAAQTVLSNANHYWHSEELKNFNNQVSLARKEINLLIDFPSIINDLAKLIQHKPNEATNDAIKEVRNEDIQWDLYIKIGNKFENLIETALEILTDVNMYLHLEDLEDINKKIDSLKKELKQFLRLPSSINDLAKLMQQKPGEAKKGDTQWDGFLQIGNKCIGLLAAAQTVLSNANQYLLIEEMKNIDEKIDQVKKELRLLLEFPSAINNLVKLIRQNSSEAQNDKTVSKINRGIHYAEVVLAVNKAVLTANKVLQSSKTIELMKDFSETTTFKVLKSGVEFMGFDQFISISEKISGMSSLLDASKELLAPEFTLNPAHLLGTEKERSALLKNIITFTRFALKASQSEPLTESLSKETSNDINDSFSEMLRFELGTIAIFGLDKLADVVTTMRTKGVQSLTLTQVLDSTYAVFEVVMFVVDTRKGITFIAIGAVALGIGAYHIWNMYQQSKTPKIIEITPEPKPLESNSDDVQNPPKVKLDDVQSPA